MVLLEGTGVVLVGALVVTQGGWQVTVITALLPGPLGVVLAGWQTVGLAPLLTNHTLCN